MILDHYDDHGKYLREVFAEGVPAFVKHACAANDSAVKFAEDYATVISGDKGVSYKYPLLDMGNAVASAVYFAKFGDGLPPEKRKEAAEAIKAALTAYGLEAPEELTKAASAELAYSPEAENAMLEDLFKSDGDVVLDEYFDDASPRARRRLFMQVKEAGVKLASARPEFFAVEMGTDVAVGIAARRLCVVEDAATDELTQMMKTASATAPEELVAKLATFDKEHQLIHLYDRHIPDPYSTVYGRVFEKSAEPVAMFNGESTKESVLKDQFQEKYVKLAEAFGEEGAKQLVAEPVTVFNSLPAPHKQAIEAICR